MVVFLKRVINMGDEYDTANMKILTSRINGNLSEKGIRKQVIKVLSQKILSKKCIEEYLKNSDERGKLATYYFLKTHKLINGFKEGDYKGVNRTNKLDEIKNYAEEAINLEPKLKDCLYGEIDKLEV